MKKKGYKPAQGKRNYVKYMKGLAMLHSVNTQEKRPDHLPDHTFMEERTNQDDPLWPSSTSRQLREELAEQGSWELVARGIVAADWYLYRRPAKGGTNSLAGQAAIKAYFAGLYKYMEEETGESLPTVADAASAAMELKFAYQRKIILLHIAYHRSG